MAQSLVTYGSDRRMVLSNGEAIRAPIYINTWTTIRIGLRGSFINVASTISGTPLWSFGVCSGNTNGRSAASSTHAVGFDNQNASLTYAAGPPAYLNVTPQSTTFFKRIGTTITRGTGGNIGANSFFSAASTIRNGVFLEITKGSPNYTFRWAMPGATTSVAQTDLSDTEFQQIMELGAPLTSANIGAVKTGYVALTGTPTLAIDEVTNGILDNIFVYWGQSSSQFSFDIKHRMVA